VVAACPRATSSCRTNGRGRKVRNGSVRTAVATAAAVASVPSTTTVEKPHAHRLRTCSEGLPLSFGELPATDDFHGVGCRNGVPMVDGTRRRFEPAPR